MSEFGMDLFGDPILKAARKMKDYFGVPPFSIIDTTEKKWRARRSRWLQLTGNLSETKEAVLGDSMLSTINEGSSNFDPVLAETMINWFNVKGGVILDPFGGEQTKGVVAGEMGCEYHGCEFRPEQVEVNRRACAGYTGINYYCGDSNQISQIIERRNFDFCFTSPPYYDLEVYSAEDMSALGTYEQFMQQYKNIFQQCYNMLRPNRFLCVKVAEIRDKKTGEYRNFVGDNITVMRECGFKYYNEIILLNAVGTLPMRSAKSMNASRKVGKRHQNVLVFYKGDLKLLNEQFEDIMPKNAYYDKSDTVPTAGAAETEPEYTAPEPIPEPTSKEIEGGGDLEPFG